MKKLILLSIAIVSLLPSFGQDSTLVGLSLAYLRDRWYTDAEYINNGINDLGGKVLLEYANGDGDTQTKQIESLIKRGVKVMIIVPADAEALSSSVAACNKANVKVIAYDRLVKNCAIDYYITFNGEKVGQLQAEYATKLKPKGNYVLVAGPKKDLNAISFLEGQKKVLEPYVKNNSIKIVYENFMSEWDPMEAFMELSNIVGSGEQIDAVIASSDHLSSGVIMAIEGNEKYKNTIITGQDATIEACQNILNNKQSMTIYKPIKILADRTAKLAMSLANESDVEGVNSETNNGLKNIPTILLDDIIVVDKDNLKETVIKDGFHTSEEIFGE